MKAFTSNTHGRDHYYYGSKEHSVPKHSKDRRGTRSSARQENQHIIKQELK
jgi:hypothetical protein